MLKDLLDKPDLDYKLHVAFKKYDNNTSREMKQLLTLVAAIRWDDVCPGLTNEWHNPEAYSQTKNQLKQLKEIIYAKESFKTNSKKSCSEDS